MNHKFRGGNNKPYRAVGGITHQTTIATSIKAGVWARVGGEVAVTATLEMMRKLDGITASTDVLRFYQRSNHSEPEKKNRFD